MKYYVRFMQEGTTGELVERLGSDGVFVLDGRNSIGTMIRDARRRMVQLVSITDIVGFKIMQGSRFANDNKCVYSE